jgi:hypothetical protein
MTKTYAQVVNGMVNLIGGEEVGLPFNNDIATSIDITDMLEEERPKEGFFYIVNADGEGYFSEFPPEPEPEPVFDKESVEQKLARIYEQNIILMDALATTFEELIALRELVEGGTK